MIFSTEEFLFGNRNFSLQFLQWHTGLEYEKGINNPWWKHGYNLTEQAF